MYVPSNTTIASVLWGDPNKVFARGVVCLSITEKRDCLTEHMARRKLDFEMLKMVDSNLFYNPDLSLNKNIRREVRVLRAGVFRTSVGDS
jgi:hypothetical protein